jgi:nitrogen fixation protein FixH
VKFLACLLCFLCVGSAFPQQLREANFDIRFEPTAILQSGTEIRFDITLRDADHKPVQGAKVTLQVETPDHEQTKVFRATEMQPGLYMAKPSFPAAGRWNVYVEARRDDAMSARRIEYYVAK